MTRFGKTSKLVAAALGGALALSACGGGSDDTDEPKDSETSAAAEGGGTITLAYEQELFTYNGNTGDGNALANSIATQWVKTGFWYFGEDGVVTPNEDFGTFEKTSDDPLTVEYQINENAAWSDGEPIDCDDIMLWWAQSGGFLGFSTAGTAGVEDTKMPTCAPGDKNFTLEYTKPYADWMATAPGHGNGALQPAHIVATQGGLADGAELIQVIQGVDYADEAAVEAANEQLADAIEFYNNGWTIDGALPSEDLIPSSGPFKFGEYKAGESLTLVPNDAYWGTAPKADEVVIRFIEQNEQAQALQNGEVDIVSPQPSTDLKAQLESLSGVELAVFPQYVYEHLTFNHDSGAFAGNPELRKAFVMCVPRQLMVDNLIKPVQEDAAVVNSTVAATLDPFYQEVVDNSVPADMAQQDIEGAKKILEDNDLVGTTVKVRTLDNPRRNQQGQLIKDACDQAGFDIDFEAHGDFFEGEGALYQNRYDVSMFAWSGSSLISGWNSQYRTVDECTAEAKGSNMGCYSNEEMDALLDQVLRTSVEQEKIDLISQISKISWEDVVAIPLFNHPGMAAWNSEVQGIVPNPAQSDIVWNMPEWTR